MDLEKEKFDELPEFMKAEFEEVDGVYKSKDSLKLAQVKSTANSLDSRVKEYESKYTELETRLNEQEQRKQEEIQRARDEALEQAKTKGESEEIHRIYEEKMADLEKRSYEKGKQEAAQEFKKQSVTKDAENLRSKLAAELARDEDSQAAIEALLTGMIKPTDEGVGFFDAKGGALSIDDVNVYKDDVIKKTSLFKHLIKPDHVVSGTGNADGGAAGDSQNVSKNTKAEEAKKKGDLTGYLKASLNLKG